MITWGPTGRQRAHRAAGDAGAVVDARLQVHGAGQLWVVDAWVMPGIVSGNTASPTVMIAEKGAAMLLAA